MSDSPVVTRIAPSPTGAMHIGTARTALFNWLYARHTGGKYLLRVEDTDRERSTEAAVQVIFDGLAWLGLEADAPAVFQASRAERHREAVDEMLARGSAYRDYMTADELEAERNPGPRRGPRGPLALARPLAQRRPRPPVRRAPEGADRRRDADRRPGEGAGHLPEQGPGRPDPAAHRRHADLQSGRGGGRSRDGGDPRDPRRRPPEQRRAPDPDLPGPRLDARRSGRTCR